MTKLKNNLKGTKYILASMDDEMKKGIVVVYSDSFAAKYYVYDFSTK